MNPIEVYLQAMEAQPGDPTVEEMAAVAMLMILIVLSLLLVRHLRERMERNTYLRGMEEMREARAQLDNERWAR